MSLLAAPRRKQRISVDPQNVNWKNSDTVGKKLLEKMNWNEGQGLGKNKQGSADNLKLNANFSGKGLGCDRDTRNKEQWISHHDDFASLLANLNKTGKQSSNSAPAADSAPSNIDTIQSRSRSLKSRMHYKFTRGKDLALATQQQKAAIFGGVKQKEIVQEKEEIKQEIQVVEEQESEEADNIQLSVSTVSATDYYKEKMAKWMNKKSSAPKEPEPIEQVEETTSKKSKKSRKRKFTEE